MQKLQINGGKKISGTVEISGSKNATLPILASTILTDKKVIVTNIPIVRDVETMVSLLKSIGSNIKDLPMESSPANYKNRRIKEIS